MTPTKLQNQAETSNWVTVRRPPAKAANPARKPNCEKELERQIGVQPRSPMLQAIEKNKKPPSWCNKLGCSRQAHITGERRNRKRRRLQQSSPQPTAATIAQQSGMPKIPTIPTTTSDHCDSFAKKSTKLRSKLEHSEPKMSRLLLNFGVTHSLKINNG